MKKQILIIGASLGIGFTTGYMFKDYQDKPAIENIVENYQVQRIIDGDTIVLSDQRRVRLIGIDTPERGEHYFQEAKIRLENLIADKQITLEKDISETDRFGRLLRYIVIDEKNINEILVREGYAQAKKYKPDTKYSEIFEQAEKEAREKQLGIWKQ